VLVVAQHVRYNTPVYLSLISIIYCHDIGSYGAASPDSQLA
jgi:hypothetical protein